MAAGKAHYSGLVLPFIVLGAAVGLGTLRGRRDLQRAASGALVLTSVAGYVIAGAGALGGNYAPASLTEHALSAAKIASSLPPDAAISAS